MLDYQPEKLKVAQSFAEAASSYDDVAVLQRHTADKLLASLGGLSLQPQVVLDLGTGTGRNLPLLNTRYPQSKLIGLDMAVGMLQKAQQNCAQITNIEWLEADLEAMPLASNSVDLVFANLAIQWCDPQQSFQQIQRVLRDKGILVFTTLASNTLSELRQAWAGVDDYPHVNQFHSVEMLEKTIQQQGFSSVELTTETQQLFYASPLEMMRDLKLLGARNMNQGRRASLTGKQRLQQVCAEYEKYRQPQGIPASYEVIYGVIQQ